MESMELQLILGKVLLEPIYEEESIKVYSNEGYKVVVIKVDDKCFAYNVETFDIILEFDATDFVTDCDRYIFNKDDKTLYIIRDGKIKTTINKCNFGSIGYYQNDYYFTYHDDNYKNVVCNYDGVEIKSNLSDVIMGKDFMYAEEHYNTIYVYDKDKLVKTLEKYSIENSGVTNSDFVILENENKYYNIFDKKGELINTTNYYSSFADSESERKIYKLSGNIEQGLYSLKESGTNKYISIMSDGQIIDSNNLGFESYIYDYDVDAYNEEYIIARNLESKNFCLVNRERKIIFDNIEYSPNYNASYMCSNLGYIGVHDRNNGKYNIYDYKNNKVIIESDSKINYVKDYKIFKTTEKIYSLDGKVIYEIK